MKYYRVKYGYKDDEFLSIDETELEKALRAQGLGMVAVFKTGSVSGNHIISITPDYQKLMGWAHDYHLTGEDMLEIGNEAINEHQQFFANMKIKISGQLSVGEEVKQIGKPEARVVKGKIDEERRVFVVE